MRITLAAKNASFSACRFIAQQGRIQLQRVLEVGQKRRLRVYEPQSGSRGLPRVVSIAISWTQWFNLWWKLLRTQSHQIIETVKLAAATPSGQKARRTSLEPPKTSRSYCSGCRFLAQDGACSVYRSCVANVTMTICNSCKLGVFRLESVRHTGLPGLAPCLASR